MKTLNRFNWIARQYDLLVKIVFGEKLHDAQLHFLKEVGSTDHVLILGGGSGKFLESLLRARPGVSVLYVEASSEMISLAKRRISAASDVIFIHGTQADIPAQRKFDAVITNFFLDLFSKEEIEQLSLQISTKLKPSAKWLATDFVESAKRKHKFLLGLMYWFFTVTGSIRVKELPPWKAAMINSGLMIVEERSFIDGFVCSVICRKP